MLGRFLDRLNAAHAARSHAHRRHRRSRRVARRAWRDDARALRLRCDSRGAADRERPRARHEPPSTRRLATRTFCPRSSISWASRRPAISTAGRSSVRRLPTAILDFEALDANLTRGWAPLTGVVAGRWKYIDLPLPELYDLATDPREERNLAGRERVAARDACAERSPNSRHRPPARRRVRTSTRRRRRGCDRSATRPHRPEPPRTYSESDDPKRLVALNEQFTTALAAFNAGRRDAALSEFLALIRQRPDFITARTSAATVLVTIGRPADAVALLRGAPEAQAASPEILAKLGTALRESRRSPGRGGRVRAIARGRQPEPGALQRSRRRLRPAGAVRRGARAVSRAAAARSERGRHVEQPGRSRTVDAATPMPRPTHSVEPSSPIPATAMRGKGSAPRPWIAIARPPSTRGAMPSVCGRTTTTCCSTSAWCWPRAAAPPMRCRT